VLPGGGVVQLILLGLDADIAIEKRDPLPPGSQAQYLDTLGLCAIYNALDSGVETRHVSAASEYAQPARRFLQLAHHMLSPGSEVALPLYQRADLSVQRDRWWAQVMVTSG